jgi:hypothetical protein
MIPLVIYFINPIDPTITLLLCPASVAGLAEPKGLLDKAVLLLIIFGGNFALYGAIGAIAGFVARDHIR